MISKIYLDMDGVLTDFYGRYKEKFAIAPSEAFRNKKDKDDNWRLFVEHKEFETLPWHKDGKELLEFVRNTKIPLSILSSSGGRDTHEEVTRQKNVWLDRNGIDFDRIIVPGRKHKKEFARSDTLLIDDTIDVVDDFAINGGFSILHNNILQTKNLIDIYTRVIY